VIGVRILGTGTALPERIVPTAQVLAEAMPDRDPDVVRERTGIQTRRWLEPGQSAAELAADAVQAALDRAGVDATELRRLIFVDSAGGDQACPATANDVALRLGVHNTCGCFDLNNACVGFVSALDLGARLVATGEAPVAIVAAEAFRRHLHADLEPRSYVVFGDAAGAVILGPSHGGAALVGADFGNDGRDRDAVTIAYGAFTGQREPIRFDYSARQIAQRAIPDMVRSCQAAAAQAGVRVPDVDWVLVHQANGPFMDAFLDSLGVHESRSVRVVDSLGSLGAAGVAVALDRLLRERPVQPGDLVLVASVGAGTARGAVLFRMPA